MRPNEFMVVVSLLLYWRRSIIDVKASLIALLIRHPEQSIQVIRQDNDILLLFKTLDPGAEKNKTKQNSG